MARQHAITHRSFRRYARAPPDCLTRPCRHCQLIALIAHGILHEQHPAACAFDQLAPWRDTSSMSRENLTSSGVRLKRSRLLISAFSDNSHSVTLYEPSLAARCLNNGKPDVLYMTAAELVHAKLMINNKTRKTRQDKKRQDKRQVVAAVGAVLLVYNPTTGCDILTTVFFCHSHSRWGPRPANSAASSAS